MAKNNKLIENLILIFSSDLLSLENGDQSLSDYTVYHLAVCPYIVDIYNSSSITSINKSGKNLRKSNKT